MNKLFLVLGVILSAQAVFENQQLIDVKRAIKQSIIALSDGDDEALDNAILYDLKRAHECVNYAQNIQDSTILTDDEKKELMKNNPYCHLMIYQNEPSGDTKKS